MLGWLERHHVPGFNSSCLYRSVAVCLFVRSSGGSAVLRIGAASSDILKAHAWVENEHGELLYEEREGWAVLQP